MALDITTVVANFDALMVSADEKIQREYESQRIIGSDYATVYLGLMQSAMQTALGYETQGQTAAAQTALLEQKVLTEEAQIKDTLTDGTVVYTPGDPNVGGGVLGKQQVLYSKQTDGFDRDAEQKLVKVMNDLYSIAMSNDDTGLITVPPENNQTGLDEVIKFAKDNLGVV